MDSMFAALIGIALVGFLLIADIEHDCAAYGEYDFSPINLVIECSIKETASGEAK